MRQTVLTFLVFFAACCTGQSGINRTTVKDGLKRNVLLLSTIGTKSGSCAGVIWHTGIVVTAKHCIGDEMTVDGRAACLLAEDGGDLAILSAHTPDFPDVVSADNVAPGDPVFSIANLDPWRDLVWVGSVVGVDKDGILSQGQNAPGVSGGGLYNDSGHLIGINTMFCCQNREGRQPLMQFAVPVASVRRLLLRLPSEP